MRLWACADIDISIYIHSFHSTSKSLYKNDIRGSTLLTELIFLLDDFLRAVDSLIYTKINVILSDPNKKYIYLFSVVYDPVLWKSL